MTKRKKINIVVAGIIISLSIPYAILSHYNSLYDPNEIKQLNAFFSQLSVDKTKTNGKALGYRYDCPLFWKKITTIKVNGIRKTESIEFFNLKDYFRERFSGTFNVDSFMYLKSISFHAEQIDSLIVTNCPMLIEIWDYHSNFSFVHIENCPSLTELQLPRNPLETLDVTGCPALEKLGVKECPLKELTVLETQPWQTWELDSTTVVVVIPATRK